MSAIDIVIVSDIIVVIDSFIIYLMFIVNDAIGKFLYFEVFLEWLLLCFLKIFQVVEEVEHDDMITQFID